MKQLIGIIVLVAIALAVLSVTPPPVREQEELAPEPAEPTAAARDTVAENYIRTNISSLSPESEVLGGTYYVTAVYAVEGRGVVSYEDGHVAYTADFTYTGAPGGNITVTSFVLREGQP